MCFGMGGGQQQQQQGGTASPAASPAATPATAAPSGATPATTPAQSVGGRRRRLNAYDGFETDMVGASMGSTQRANDNSPSGALKKLMGA